MIHPSMWRWGGLYCYVAGQPSPGLGRWPGPATPDWPASVESALWESPGTYSWPSFHCLPGDTLQFTRIMLNAKYLHRTIILWS